MPRRPSIQALSFVEVSDLPADGVVVRKHGRSYAAPLPAAMADVSPEVEVFVVPKDKMLTPREAGELIGISTSRVKQLLDADALPYESVGRDRRILADDAIAYRDKRCQRIEVAAGGFMSKTELERPDPTLEQILEDVE